MKIVTLKDITLSASSVPEDQYNGAATSDGEWSAGTYDVDDIVYYTGDIPHKVYKSVATSNTAVPGTDVEKWTDLGATDRWRMFDEYINTVTSYSGDLVVTIDATDCDYVGLFNCVAQGIDFSLSVGGTVVASESIDMDMFVPYDYDEWFFMDSEFSPRVIWTFPMYTSTALLTITFYNVGGLSSCGMCVVGSGFFVGRTLFDSEVGFDDYSYKYENETTGAVKMLPGNYRDVGSFKVWANADRMDMIKLKLIQNRGLLALYDFNNDETNYDSFIFLGFTPKHRIGLKMKTLSRIDFTMEGVI